MKISHIRLEEFNDCPGADAIKHYLATHKLEPYIRVVDLDQPQHSYHLNSGDTLVLAILKSQTEMTVALTLGQMAVRFSADEFIWSVIDGTFIVRLWWD